MQWHRSHGIDTLFFGEGSAGPCGSSTPGTEIAGKLAPRDDFYCLIDTSIPPSKLQNSSNVLGILLADEADSHVSCCLFTYPLSLYGTISEFCYVYNIILCCSDVIIIIWSMCAR